MQAAKNLLSDRLHSRLPSHIAEGFFLCDNVRNPAMLLNVQNIADRNLGNQFSG